LIVEPSTSVVTWIGAILVLMTLTFLYKDTILFRIVERTMVGAAIGHTVVVALKNINDLGVASIPKDPLVVVPIVLGLLLFMRFHKTYHWLTRYGVAVIVGIGTGLTFRAIIITQFISQLQATVLSLTTVNNIIIFVGVLCTVAFFILTIEPKGLLRHISRIGLWFMMIAFGVSFGGALIGRITYIISAIRFLLFEWLGIA